MTSSPADNNHNNPTGLQVATDALARALVQVWEVCDQLPWQHTRPDGTAYAAGANLPEALSMALALAATELLAAGGESAHQFFAEKHPHPPPARLLGSGPCAGPHLPSRAVDPRHRP